MRIKDLNYIKETLRNSHFSSTDWFELGMDLDIEYNNLKAIEKNYEQKGGADRCLTECLAEWLRSDVKATYRELVNALKKIKQNAVAEDITNSKHSCNNKVLKLYMQLHFYSHCY